MSVQYPAIPKPCSSSSYNAYPDLHTVQVSLQHKDTIVLATGFEIRLNTTLPSGLGREIGGSDVAKRVKTGKEYDDTRGLEQILRV